MPSGTRENPTYKIAELGSLLDLSRNRIHELGRMGILVKVENGRYDMRASVLGYIKWLRDRALRKNPGPDGEQGESSKARKMKAEAEMAEIELDTLKGNRLVKDQAEEAWLKTAAMLRTRLVSIPTTLTPQIMQYMRPNVVPTDVEQRIRDIIDQVLIDLQKTQITHDVEDTPEDEGDG